MKSSLAISALILAIGAGVGWHDYQHLAAIRATRGQRIAEAATRGVALDLSETPGLARRTKHAREDRAASARLIAAEFIAFGKAREAFEQATDGQPDAAMQKEMGRRMAEFRERMMSMDPTQVSALIAEIRTSHDLTEETRQRLVAISLLALANDHPQAMLALLTGSDFAKDDSSGGGYAISSSLARWAKDDPLAALEWVRNNAAKFPQLITDDAKRGLLSGTAIQDPQLAFKLIEELPVDNGRDATLKRIYQEWPRRDPASIEAAAAFAQQHGIK